MRAAEPGQSLTCLVLVPGPDWVALDTATGALVRASLPPTEPVRLGRQLSAVGLRIAAPSVPEDGSRPEAIQIDGEPLPLAQPRRRAVKHVLARLAVRGTDRPLLGTLGPSIAFGDLDGTRPSVVLVAPDSRPRFGNGPEGPWCHFNLGGRRHSISYVGEPLWQANGELSQPVKGGRGDRKKAGAVVASVKYLVVALGTPSRGQVPKVVLGALPAA